jgi:hypothetical protein
MPNLNIIYYLHFYPKDSKHNEMPTNINMRKPLRGVETHFLTLLRMCLNLATFFWHLGTHSNAAFFQHLDTPWVILLIAILKWCFSFQSYQDVHLLKSFIWSLVSLLFAMLYPLKFFLILLQYLQLHIMLVLCLSFASSCLCS